MSLRKKASYAFKVGTSAFFGLTVMWGYNMHSQNSTLTVGKSIFPPQTKLQVQRSADIHEADSLEDITQRLIEQQASAIPDSTDSLPYQPRSWQQKLPEPEYKDTLVYTDATRERQAAQIDHFTAIVLGGAVGGIIGYGLTKDQ